MQRAWVASFISVRWCLLLLASDVHQRAAWAQSSSTPVDQLVCQEAVGGGGAAAAWPEQGETDPPHTDAGLKHGHGNVRARLCVKNDADAVVAVIPWRQRRLINAWCVLHGTGPVYTSHASADT